MTEAAKNTPVYFQMHHPMQIFYDRKPTVEKVWH